MVSYLPVTSRSRPRQSLCLALLRTVKSGQNQSSQKQKTPLMRGSYTSWFGQLSPYKDDQRMATMQQVPDIQNFSYYFTSL